MRCLFPRVAKARPWAGIRERFQRYLSDEFFQKWVPFRLFVQTIPNANKDLLALASWNPVKTRYPEYSSRTWGIFLHASRSSLVSNNRGARPAVQHTRGNKCFPIVRLSQEDFRHKRSEGRHGVQSRKRVSTARRSCSRLLSCGSPDERLSRAREYQVRLKQ
jgi:hypothetical protein